MKIYIKLAWRYITSYKKRSIAMILAIMLSSFLIITIGSLSESSKKSQADYIRKTSGAQHVRYNELNLDQVKKIRKNENIKTLSNANYYDEGVIQNRISINLVAAEENMLYMDNTKLLKGEYPKKSNEIVLEEWVLERLKLSDSIGQFINIVIKGDEKSYKLAGVVKDRESRKALGKLEGYILFDENNLPHENHIFTFIEFKEDINIRNEIDKLAKEIGLTDKKEMKKNEMLLNSIGQLEATDWDLIKTSLILMIVGGMVVYSLYSISVGKRSREYGVIRAIGATYKGIIYVSLIEILIIYIFGLVLGTSLSVVCLNLLKGITISLFTEGNTKLDIITMSKYAFILASVTTFIAVISACIKGVILLFKISPMEAINKHIQDNKVNFNDSQCFIEKSLGMIKKVSYKNLKRNKKSFILTISAMAIGSTLFTYQTFEYKLWARDYEYRKSIDKSMTYDFRLHLNPSVPMKEGYSKDQIKDLKEIEGIKDVYNKQVIYSKIKFDDKYVVKPYGKTFIEYADETARGLETIEYRYLFKGDSKDDIIINSDILGFSDNDIKDLEKMSGNKINANEMKKEAKAILVMPKTFIDPDGEFEDKNLTDVFNFKTGDKLKISIPKKGYEESLDNWELASDYEKYKSEYTDTEFEIISIITESNIDYRELDSAHLGGQPTLIISEDVFKEFSGIDKYRIVNIRMEDKANYLSVKKKIQNMSEIFYDTWMEDYTGQSMEDKRALSQYSIFKNSIIIVLIIISGLSIFNNINYNLEARIREHGIMKAIGMTDRQFKKMIRFEGLMYGGVSAILTCIISLIIQVGMFMHYKEDLVLKEFFIDIQSYIVVIVMNLTLGYIATIAPRRRINKLEITEAVKIVE